MIKNNYLKKISDSKKSYIIYKSAKGFDLWYIRSLLTILFPPFGVFMAKGLKGMKQLIICSILTMCFYFPGLIYAISVINSSKK